MALQHFGPWQLFQFLNPIHSRWDSTDGGSARRRAATYTQNTRTQTSMLVSDFGSSNLPVMSNAFTVYPVFPPFWWSQWIYLCLLIVGIFIQQAPQFSCFVLKTGVEGTYKYYKGFDFLTRWRKRSQDTYRFKSLIRMIMHKKFKNEDYVQIQLINLSNKGNSYKQCMCCPCIEMGHFWM
jgi:hypothetical protein